MSLFHISNSGTVKTIYFVCFYSGMKYGIIFWGYSCNRIGKLLELGLVQNLCTHVEICLRVQEFYLFHKNVYFH